MIFLQNRLTIKVPQGIIIKNTIKNLEHILEIKENNVNNGELYYNLKVPKLISLNFNIDQKPIKNKYSNDIDDILFFTSKLLPYSKLPKKVKQQFGTFMSQLDQICLNFFHYNIINLELFGIGFKVVQDKNVLNLKLGYSHNIIYKIPQNILVYCPTPTTITLLSKDKQLLGQVAADLRQLKKPEPYKGKGIRYVGEQIILKEVKKGKK